MKRVRYHLQFEAVAPGSLCAAGTLAVPYLLYRLFTCSYFSSPFSADTFQRQCSTSAHLPAPLCLSAVVLSPYGLFGVLVILPLLSGVSRLFCLGSLAWLPSCYRLLFSLPLPCGDSQESLTLPAQVLVLVFYLQCFRAPLASPSKQTQDQTRRTSVCCRVLILSCRDRERLSSLWCLASGTSLGWALNKSPAGLSNDMQS